MSSEHLRFRHIYMGRAPLHPLECLIVDHKHIRETMTQFPEHINFSVLLPYHIGDVCAQLQNIIEEYRSQNQRIHSVTITSALHQIRRFRLNIWWKHIHEIVRHFNIHLNCIVIISESHIDDTARQHHYNPDLIALFDRFILHYNGMMDGYHICKQAMFRLFESGIPSIRIAFPFFHNCVFPLHKYNLGGFLYFNLAPQTPRTAVKRRAFSESNPDGSKMKVVIQDPEKYIKDET